MKLSEQLSPNYTPNSKCKQYYGIPRTFEEIVIHWWGDPKNNPTLQGTVNYLTNGTRPKPTSAHYVVSDKQVYRLVKEEDVAWANGDANPWTISIEVDPNTPGDTYKTVAQLVTDIRNRRGNLDLVPHNKYSNTQCPGTVSLTLIEQMANSSEGMVSIPQKELDEMRNLRDTRYNFIKDICELFGVSYQDKLDKLLENFKSVWAGHQSTVSRLKGDVEKLTGDLGVANEKKKIAEQALADEIKECSRRVTELEILLQEAKKDSPDLEKLVDEYEGMLGVEREHILQLQKKYDKSRLDLARVTSQLKALPFIEKLKLLFL